MAEYLGRIQEAIDRLTETARSGRFDQIRDLSFPVSRAEVPDIAVVACEKMSKEFARRKSAAVSFGSRYQEVSVDCKRWLSRRVPAARELNAEWDDAESLAVDGIGLQRRVDELVKGLADDPLWKWMAAGALESSLAQMRARLRIVLANWEGDCLAHASEALDAGDRRACVLDLQMLLRLQSRRADDIFVPAGKSFVSARDEMEAEINKRVEQLYNEGYMLQYASPARLGKMREVVAVGLPYHRAVRAAERELAQARRAAGQE